MTPKVGQPTDNQFYTFNTLRVGCGYTDGGFFLPQKIGGYDYTPPDDVHFGPGIYNGPYQKSLPLYFQGYMDVQDRVFRTDNLVSFLYNLKCFCLR